MAFSCTSCSTAGCTNHSCNSGRGELPLLPTTLIVTMKEINHLTIWCAAQQMSVCVHTSVYLNVVESLFSIPVYWHNPPLLSTRAVVVLEQIHFLAIPRAAQKLSCAYGACLHLDVVDVPLHMDKCPLLASMPPVAMMKINKAVRAAAQQNPATMGSTLHCNVISSFQTSALLQIIQINAPLQINAAYPDQGSASYPDQGAAAHPDYPNSRISDKDVVEA